MTVEQFNDLLRLMGRISVETWDPFSAEKKQRLEFCGIANHTKMGIAGQEDMANHFFETQVLYEGRLCEARVSANSEDGGKTYQGGVVIEVYPDNMSE